MASKKTKVPAEEMEIALQGEQTGVVPVTAEPVETVASGEIASEPAAQSEKKPRRTRKVTPKESQSDTVDQEEAKLLFSLYKALNRLFRSANVEQRKPSLIKQKIICSICWSPIRRAEFSQV